MSCSSCETHHHKSPGLVESLRNSNRFTRGVLTLAGEQGGLFMDRLVNLAESTILTPIPSPRGVCDFPEIECPPKIACTLIREVFPGERIVEPVLVRNLGHESKEFVFQTAVLETVDGIQGGPLIITPHNVTLQAGKAAAVAISYEVTTKFLPGHRYSADVKVEGYCEQIIRVVAHVASLDFARCTIAQKECHPDRRHYWQDHFYCEPRKSKPQVEVQPAAPTTKPVTRVVRMAKQ